MQELAATALVEVSGTISRLLGLAAAGVAFAALIYDGRLRPFMPVHAYIVMYLAWGCVTYLWSADQSLTYGRLITNMQLLIMVLLFAQFASREDENAGLILAYVVGSLISVIELLRRYATGDVFIQTLWHERFTAFDNNPNDYALAISLAIPMAWYLASRRISFFTTILGYGYTGLGFMGVVMTGSRGGFLAAIAGALTIPFGMFRLGRRERIAAIVVVLMGFVLSTRYAPDTVWARLLTIGDVVDEVPSSEMEGINIRTVIWKQGIWEFTSNPQAASVGVGAGAYKHGVEPIYGDHLVAHNVFLSILVEQGIIGMSIFLIILWNLFTLLKYLPKAERFMWFFVFLAWGVGVQFVTWEHTKNTWFIIGLLAARNLSAKDARDAKPGFLANLFRKTKVGTRLRRPVYHGH